jgi:hypothetical protein
MSGSVSFRSKTTPPGSLSTILSISWIPDFPSRCGGIIHSLQSGKMNHRAVRRAVSKIATPKFHAASGGVFSSRESGTKYFLAIRSLKMK